MAIAAALCVPRQLSTPPLAIVSAALQQVLPIVPPKSSIVPETEKVVDVCSTASFTLSVPEEKRTGELIVQTSDGLPPGPSPTSMVAPMMERVPAPLTVGLPSIVNALPVPRVSVAPEEIVKAPLWMPPLRMSVPTEALTAPPLLLSKNGAIVLDPVPPLLLMVPRFSTTALPERRMLPSAVRLIEP